MPVYHKRVAPHIYYICYSGQMSLADLRNGQTQMHYFIAEHNELDDKYIIIYERTQLEAQPRVNFSAIKSMLRETPSLRAEDSIFVNFPPALRTIINLLHRIVTGKGEIHFVETRAEAINLAYAILAAEYMDDINLTPIP